MIVSNGTGYCIFTDALLLLLLFSPVQRPFEREKWKDFEREHKIHQNLRHPNIIRLIEAIESPGEIIVITECADIDLSRFMEQERRQTQSGLSEKVTQRLTWDLLSALFYLHSQCILHRDIKPENILLNADGTRARLCDFGLARQTTKHTYLLMSTKVSSELGGLDALL